MEFDKEKGAFTYSEETRVADIARDETSERRMARICLVAMNSINVDLEFTIEVVGAEPLIL